MCGLQPRSICANSRVDTQFHGNMTQKARDSALDDFKKKPNIKILLTTIQSGGIGLNLTEASRVIILDPWWNQAREQQAFCRIYRIGQDEETCLTRFCVKDTVDEAMLNMQSSKQIEIDDIFDDENNAGSKRLSLKDLLRIFGEVGEADGHPYIITGEKRQGR